MFISYVRRTSAGHAEALYQLAEQLAQAAAERWSRMFGSAHPDTLWAMGNLAESRRAQGDLDRAADLLEDVMEGRLRVLGGSHPDTLWAVTTLADVRRAQGDTASAEELTARATAMRRNGY